MRSPTQWNPSIMDTQWYPHSLTAQPTNEGRAWEQCYKFLSVIVWFTVIMGLNLKISCDSQEYSHAMFTCTS